VKSVICAIVLAALTSPAFANEWWVEFNWSTHQCSVVEKKPQETASSTPQEAATNTPDVAPSGTPNAGTMPTMLPGSSAPAQTTVVPGPLFGKSPDAAASAPPTTVPGNPAAAPGTSAATNPEDKKNDPFAAVAAARAAKLAALEAAGTLNVQKEFIGTAQHSREQAEAEIRIMRKCGLAN